jgi:hypothetical protein
VRKQHARQLIEHEDNPGVTDYLGITAGLDIGLRHMQRKCGLAWDFGDLSVTLKASDFNVFIRTARPCKL